jgi:uroporphyrinogen decarboxylase
VTQTAFRECNFVLEGIEMTPTERFLAACRHQPVDRPPIWLMRQAGRYLPEYQQVRSRSDFMAMCHTPEQACELTLQPVRRFGMDAAIIFSDILVVPEAMGLDLSYGESGPALVPAVRSRSVFSGLRSFQPDRELAYVGEAIRLARAQLAPDTPLIGFAGAPFTLASYMMEGASGKDRVITRELLYRDPALVHDLLEHLSDGVAQFLAFQVKCGAAVVQLFDSCAGMLAPGDYEQFALPYVRKVIEQLRPLGIPVILFAGEIAGILEKVRESGADVLSVDWRIRLADVRWRVGSEVALQGNLDPAELFGPPERIRRRVAELFAETQGQGHVFNLGHGVHPRTPVEGVQAFVQAVQALGRKSE